MNARERIAALLWWSVPGSTDEEAKTRAGELLDAFAAEVRSEGAAPASSALPVGDQPQPLDDTRLAEIRAARYTLRSLAAADCDIDALLAEVERLKAERHTTNEALSDAAEALRANRDRIAELERPAVQAKRNEIRSSYAETIAMAREDRDFEGAFNLECQLRDREEQWKREDAAITTDRAEEAAS
ncbi:hypothetical protein [Streptomyces sp. NPDC050416]|uniref:hypothetical protein n=1 Tax=Streptomyces sp. NPDC050416 TaxID=3365611 RepID=UPI0037BC6E3B